MRHWRASTQRPSRLIRSRTSTNTHEAQILAPATAPPGPVAANVLLSPVLPSSQGHIFQVFNVVLPAQDPTKQNQHSMVQTSGICCLENWFASSLQSLSSSQYLHSQPCFFGETEVGGEKNILVFNLSNFQLQRWAVELSDKLPHHLWKKRSRYTSSFPCRKRICRCLRIRILQCKRSSFLYTTNC